MASINSSTLLYYHDDHLGGTNVLTDSVGTLKEIIEYEPFGSESRHDKLGNSNEVAWYYFTGKKKDDETGLIYFGARYYDPSIGRFITADTIVQSPDSPQTLNRYSYVSNNPVNRTDPTGHSWKSFWKKFGDFISPFFRAVVTGEWEHFAVIAVSVAANILLPGFGTLSSNFLINVGAHALIGAAEGAVIGGISSVIMGGNFGDGAKLGAITGGIMGSFQGVTTSEQFGNWRAGNGFKSNATVRAENRRVDNMKAALRMTKENNITPSQQTIDDVVATHNLDTTYMKGNRPFYNPYQAEPGSTEIFDGLVTIGPSAFKSKGYLASVIGHEGIHTYDVGLTRSLYLNQPISEINATQWMLNNATKLYNTSKEISEFQNYHNYWSKNFWGHDKL